LDIPRLGCVNIHASLLPRWRGAAPIQRAIEAGDRETGISLMQMDAGLDTGGLLSLHPLAISDADNAGSLHDKLASLGATSIVDLLPKLEQGAINAVPQDSTRSTYAAKITKDEARLDWRRPAVELDRQIRAFNPFPGGQTDLHGAPLKVWQASLGSGHGAPGEILSVSPSGIRVACGRDALILLELQQAGGKRLPVAAFLAGHPLQPGERLGPTD
jgi:methionyl-tRNA formyltransferase